jgi:hypothetical protein
MRYLLDANTLITAKNDCYRFDVFPGFWTWLSKAHEAGQVFSILRIKRELDTEGDALTNWVNHNGTFFLNPDAKTNKSMGIIGEWVLKNPQFTAAAKDQFFSAADHALISHAHAHNFVVVTFEKDRPEAKSKIQIPTVCRPHNVRCIDLWHLLSELKAKV